MGWYQRVVRGNLREAIFGIEDGLVSTLGVVTGIVSGTDSRSVVLLSGLIVIVVEALSMAAGVYLSNQAEIDQQRLRSRKRTKKRAPIFGAVVMYFAYTVGGSVPVAPYIFVPFEWGLAASVAATAVVLFALGYFKGAVTRTPKVRSAVQMTVVALSAALIGYIVGEIGGRLLHTLT